MAKAKTNAKTASKKSTKVTATTKTISTRGRVYEKKI